MATPSEPKKPEAIPTESEDVARRQQEAIQAGLDRLRASLEPEEAEPGVAVEAPL